MIDIKLAEDVCRGLDLVCLADEHPGLAAWVQAIGSILAILVAALMAWLPIQHQRRERRRAEAVILTQILRELGAVKSSLEFADTCAKSNKFARDPLTEAAKRMDQAISSLEKLARAAPDAQIAGMVSMALDAARDAAPKLRTLIIAPITLSGKFTMDCAAAQRISANLSIVNIAHGAIHKRLPEWKPRLRRILGLPVRYDDDRFHAAASD